MTIPARLCISLLFAVASTFAHAHASRAEQFASIRVSALGHQEIFEDVIWQKKDGRDGSIDTSIASAFIDVPSPTPPKLILDIKPARSAAKVSVRQRSVTFLEVGAEGPHSVVGGSEQRSGWTPLKAYAPGRFMVLKTVRQKIRLRPALFAKAFATESEWLALAKTCKSPDDGACYTITDPEFEVTVTSANGQVTRKVVRVFTPDGC